MWRLWPMSGRRQQLFRLGRVFSGGAILCGWLNRYGLYFRFVSPWSH